MLFGAGLMCLAQSQQSQPQRHQRATQDGGVREVLESIVIPPIRTRHSLQPWPLRQQNTLPTVLP